MSTLTKNKVKIDGKTKLLINGSEVLTNKGIKGSINKVGVGFGTGRHTSVRKMVKEDIKREAEVSLPIVWKRTEPEMRDASV